MLNQAAVVLISVLFACSCADSKGMTPLPSLELLQVLPASKRVEVGDQFQLGAQRVLGRSAENVTAQTTLRSDDEATVSVSYDKDQGAVARALRPGTAHIIAEFEGMSGMAEVIVSAAVSAIELEPAPQVLPLGTQKSLGAALIAGAEKRGLDDGSWGSADPAIASVDEAGLVTAKSTGTTTITLTRAGLVASTRVHVAALALTSAQLTASFGAQLVAAGTGKLRVSGTFSGDVVERTADISSMFAFAAGPDMAPVTVEGAKVTAGSAAGTATIVATGKPGSLAADMRLELQVEVIALASLQALSIEIPETIAFDMEPTKFRGLGDFGAGMLLETKPEMLAAEPVSAVSIDLQSNTLSPLMIADVKLTATQNVAAEGGMGDPRKVEAVAMLTIVDEPLSGLTLAAAPDPLRPGQTLQLTATALHGATLTQVVTDSALWSSGDPNVAVVSNISGGKVTALQPGTTTLTASYRGQLTSMQLLVSAP
jgi:hypothetical protein